MVTSVEKKIWTDLTVYDLDLLEMMEAIVPPPCILFKIIVPNRATCDCFICFDLEKGFCKILGIANIHDHCLDSLNAQLAIKFDKKEHNHGNVVQDDEEMALAIFTDPRNKYLLWFMHQIKSLKIEDCNNWDPDLEVTSYHLADTILAYIKGVGGR
eukprot:15334380-Ditylum_brightwellii.AAC.3